MIYIVGSGNMAFEYAKVLISLNEKFIVIGRGRKNNDKFKELLGIEPFSGGVEKFLLINSIEINSKIIIATGTENLIEILKLFIKINCKNILIEKPAAISIDELLLNRFFLNDYANNIYVAYNRRFYSSVKETKEIIKNDGGLLSMNFEFTEWIHEWDKIISHVGVKENIFFNNSTHVIDLAFHFAGKPVNWKSYSKEGVIPWLKKTIFVGSGITENNVLFTYSSNWESAGRWSIELMTKFNRIILKPLELIQIQQKGTIKITEHNFNNELDIIYKPGLYKQVLSFLSNEKRDLLSLKEHISFTQNVYSKIHNP